MCFGWKLIKIFLQIANNRKKLKDKGIDLPNTRNGFHFKSRLIIFEKEEQNYKI